MRNRGFLPAAPDLSIRAAPAHGPVLCEPAGDVSRLPGTGRLDAKGLPEGSVLLSWVSGQPGFPVLLPGWFQETSLNALFWTFHINGITSYGAFRIWLLSLSIRFLRFIRVAVCIGASFFSLAE